MKMKITVVLVAIALMTMQACGSKTENNDELSMEESTEASETLAKDERQANAEKAKMELAEQRRLEFDEVSKKTPFYSLPNGRIVYNKAEKLPTYTGGASAMNKFLEDNLKFPVSAEEEGLEGTVFVDFIVDSDGNIGEASATSYTYETVDPAFQKEALRVVNLMPRWIPGSQNGKPVDVKFSVPITFMLR